MKRIHSGLLKASFLASTLFFAAPASAGSFGAVIDVGWRSMSNAPDTEWAIFQKRGVVAGGLGVTYDFGSRWRFGVEGRQISRDGERAFAADGNSIAYRLGHPLSLKMTQALATASFRFGKLGPISPYLTVGAGLASWKESSDIAGVVEKADGSSGLFEARLGIERQQGPIRIGVEAGITMVPGAVGVGGISQVYGEKDLGGFFVVGRLGFGGKK